MVVRRREGKHCITIVNKEETISAPLPHRQQTFDWCPVVSVLQVYFIDQQKFTLIMEISEHIKRPQTALLKEHWTVNITIHMYQVVAFSMYSQYSETPLNLTPSILESPLWWTCAVVQNQLIHIEIITWESLLILNILFGPEGMLRYRGVSLYIDAIVLLWTV